MSLNFRESYNIKSLIGVDVAVKAIQVFVYTNNKVQSNTEMTPKQFTAYLSTLIPSKVVFESCAGANYWSQLASDYGHDA